MLKKSSEDTCKQLNFKMYKKHETRSKLRATTTAS